MKLPRREVLVGAVVALVVAAAAWVLWNARPANNANFPDGLQYLCTSRACGHAFTLTMTQLSDHQKKHYGEPVKCTKCGAEARRADRCPSCAKVFTVERNQSACPHCKKPLAGGG